MPNQQLKLSRDTLQAFLPNDRSVKEFEALLNRLNTLVNGVQSVSIDGSKLGISVSPDAITESGTFELDGIIPLDKGGTGQANPTWLTTDTPLTVTITGKGPNQVISVVAGGSSGVKYEDAVMQYPETSVLPMDDTSGTSMHNLISGSPAGTYSGCALNQASILPCHRGKSVKFDGIASFANADLGLGGFDGGFYTEVSFTAAALPCSGQILYIRKGATQIGIGIGIGNTTYENVGSQLVILRENVAWVQTGYQFTSLGPHLISLFTAGNQYCVAVDGLLVGFVNSPTSSASGSLCYLGGDPLYSLRYFAGNIQYWSCLRWPGASLGGPESQAGTAAAISTSRYVPWIVGA